MMNIQQIDAQFSTCPQISAADLTHIAALGFKTVVNFRPDGEGGEAQPSQILLAEAAAALGLAYAYIPTIPTQIEPAQVQALAKILAQQPKPVLGFCRTGNRASKVYQLALQADKPACCVGSGHDSPAPTGVFASIKGLFKNQ